MKKLILFFLLTFSLNMFAQITFKQVNTHLFQGNAITSCSGFNGITSGDFNADGNGDIAVLRSCDSILAVSFGNGTGIFGNALLLNIPEMCNKPNIENIILTSGDIDNDGKSEILLNTCYSSPSLLYTDTLIIYKYSSNSILVDTSFVFQQNGIFITSDIKVADINGDTLNDLIFSYSSYGISDFTDAKILLNFGGYNFSSTYYVENEGGVGNWNNPSMGSTRILISDFNNDGKNDIVLQNKTKNVSVLITDTLQSIDTAISIFTPNGIPFETAIGNFNSDTIPDILVKCLNDTVNKLPINYIFSYDKATNNFTISSSFQDVLNGPTFKNMQPFDYNFDGKTDIISWQGYGNLNSQNKVCFSDGSNGFIYDTLKVKNFNVLPCGGYNISPLYQNDFNNDGFMDFAYLSNDNYSNTALCDSFGIYFFLYDSLSVNSTNQIHFTPNISGTCGFTSINFFGANIQPKMHLKFTASGQTDIEVPDSNISYTGTQTFKANVDFSTATICKYNVVLTDSNGLATTINDGFEVQSTTPPNLEIKILGPSQTRIGLPTRYYLKVTNNGNCDVFGIPIMLFVSGDNILSFADTVRDMYGNMLDTMIYAELNNYFEQEGRGKGYIFLLNNVGANKEEYFPLNIIALSPHENCRIDASISNPILDSVTFSKKSRSVKGIRGIMASEPFNCIYGTIENIAGFFVSDIANCAYNSYKLVLAGVFMQPADLGYTISSLALSCTQAALTIAAPQAKFLQIGLDILDKGVNTSGLSNSFSACNKWLNPHYKRDTKNFEGRSAHDPNDKYGIGYGIAHWINNTEILSYGIHFENVDTASASAQVVILRDTLDISKVDITTFKPELITIGNHPIDFSTNKTNQPLLYDMRPALNLIVKIEIILDSVIGEVKVVYTSLDPATMQLTTDPLLGFLPPNINKPDGEGSFYYSVKLKAGLPNNTVIDNTANIYFDFNDPILTPTWSNTIDILPPTSKMNAIVPNTNDTIIYLSWSGADAQSGVQKYDVMYSENGGAFQTYVTNFANDSIRFNGKVGSSYSFYTVAIDNVGNRESKTNGEVSAKINEQDVQIFPNPSNGEFTVQTKNNLLVSSISLFNLQGQKMPITYKKVNNTFKVQVSNNQNVGNYILKIITADKTISRKITIEK